ncbi:uncharacterized protein NEMAJ01_0828 [Nematocida major]|uniref:uncharacterized protein n=1 Tax=Nematocida major TaxID=1912982 RepID=UPI002007F207|nr:uncharacterized protein NEMAJ01_0828 [Nematocida major]KAH9385932.1 hypothetical protein NEMAJ01_0828 [Nematocida major]
MESAYSMLRALFREQGGPGENAKNVQLLQGDESMLEMEKRVEKEILAGALDSIPIECCTCVNGKLLVAQCGSGYIVLTDPMNTVPLDALWRGAAGLAQRAELAPLRYGEGLYATKARTYRLQKRCRHGRMEAPKTVPAGAEAGGLYYLEYLLAASLMQLLEGEESVYISFSGGIDSFLCATMCCKHVKGKKIYLINSCFSSNGRFQSRDRAASKEFYTRILETYGCRDRCFLVENDVHRAEILEQKDAILEITKGTTMDFNLAALHCFTARRARQEGASLVVTGTGGDELFLGYSRHREAVSCVAEEGACGDCGSTTERLQQMIKSDVEGFWETNLHRDCRAGMAGSVSYASPFLIPEVYAHALRSASPAGVGKTQLTDILHREYPGIVLKKKLAGQYGSGISDVIRSIWCRAPTLCRNNECLSLECAPAARPERGAEVQR